MCGGRVLESHESCLVKSPMAQGHQLVVQLAPVFLKAPVESAFSQPRALEPLTDNFSKRKSAKVCTMRSTIHAESTSIELGYLYLSYLVQTPGDHPNFRKKLSG